MQRKLRQVGFPDGKLPGVAYDESGGHGADPWRSVLRRKGMPVKVGRPSPSVLWSLRMIHPYDRLGTGELHVPRAAVR